MPRRATPDPTALAVGERIRQLRMEQNLTAERLAFEGEVGSKGYLSDIEHGLARPSIHTLQRIANYLGVELLDLFTFPETGDRAALVDQTRALGPGVLRRLLREMRGALTTTTARGPVGPKKARDYDERPPGRVMPMAEKTAARRPKKPRRAPPRGGTTPTA